MNPQLSLGTWTSTPSHAHTRTHARSTATATAKPSRLLAWTLGPWVEEVTGFVRYWLADGHDAAPRVAACVEPDDCSDGWTLTVLRPVGSQGDRVSWWTGGGFVALEPVADPEALPVEGEQRVRRADGRLLRVKEVPLPHREALEAAQAMADRSLAKMAKRWGRGA